MEIDKVTQGVLNVIDNGTFKQEGAYNLRYNGQPFVMETANILK